MQLPFQPITNSWFTQNFQEATAVQSRGWPLIAAGHHCLLLAPTGSGKTLAAFLWCIDRLLHQPSLKPGTRVLYVSPLKALVYDIQRNLRNPLAGIVAHAQLKGLSLTAPSVAVRTGDTSSAERAAQKKHPADILVTTPESLFLLLSSEARAGLAGVETVIIDEIHSLAPSKRGAHLALSLERLSYLCGQEPQRIGLSATVRPVEEVAHFLGGDRPVEVVDTLAPPKIDVQILTPAKDEMAQSPPNSLALPIPISIPVPIANSEEPTSILGQLVAQENKLWNGGGMAYGQAAEGANSIWPLLYPKLLELVLQHTSTIIFVNSRGLAERLALRLNELNGEQSEPLVRAHHGSVSHEERREMEEALKGGTLRGIVATSSLELGIDMGAVDLVVLVESPGAVSSGLQRVGRAGHQVGQTSVARLFPKFRGDLLESAVVVDKMRKGEIEALRIPRLPLDVLAQQVVAMTCDRAWRLEDLEKVVKRSRNFTDLSRELLLSVLDMLSGRFPSTDFSELSARVDFDREQDIIKARAGSKLMVLANAGTIPDRGLYGVFLRQSSEERRSTRVGELDEEMVHEIRAGQNFLLGASTWRVDEITRDKVYVTPAPGQPGRMPFWKGEGPGRPLELGMAMGRFLRQLEDQHALQEHYSLDEQASQDLWEYIQEQKQATGTLPTDTSLTVERFRDELGDWRLCLLSPFGSQVHAPWALALEATLSQHTGHEVQTLWSDDGIVLRYSDLGDEEAPQWPSFAIDPEDLEELVLQQLSHSALFAGQFRENAGRSLLLPRKRPGQRSPLWAQRLKAQNLLACALQFPNFPIVLETYRSCLQDVFDLPALKQILTKIQTRQIRLIEVESHDPSPFARTLVYRYVANYLYQEDTPLAERKAQALTLDRSLLSELLGQEELSELLDPECLEELLSEVQFRHSDRQAKSPQALHDLLRRLGELTSEEIGLRYLGPTDRLNKDLQGRAVELRLGGKNYWVAIEDAALYRDALGCALPSSLPAAFLAPTPLENRPLEQIFSRRVRQLGPFSPSDFALRYALPIEAVIPILQNLERQRRLSRGQFSPNSQPELLDPELLRRWRRASLAKLRGQVAPVESSTLARFLGQWQGVRTPTPKSSGSSGSTSKIHQPEDREKQSDSRSLLEVIGLLEGLPLSFSDLEKQILPARLKHYHPRQLDELGQMGSVVWVGQGALGNRDGKVALYRRERAPLLLRENENLGQLEQLHREVVQILSQRGAVFFSDLRGTVGVNAAQLETVLEDLIWAGLVTNDLFSPLRALLSPIKQRGRLNPFGGRWTLVSSLTPADIGKSRGTEHQLAWARTLLDRYGIVSKEVASLENFPGGFSPLYDVFKTMEEAGKLRRGFFVEGLSGAQFAYSQVVDQLRAARELQETQVGVLAACDPANPYGGLLPWPTAEGEADNKKRARPRRVAGGKIVLVDGLPAFFVEASAKKLVTFPALNTPALAQQAAQALTQLAATAKGKRLHIEQIDGQPASSSPWAPLLQNVGFKTDWLHLVFYASPSST